MNYDGFKDDDLTLRDHLALDRTRLANERTLLSYFRTAIMLAVSGVTLTNLYPGSTFALVGGSLLAVAGFALAMTAIQRTLKVAKGLRTLREKRPPQN